LIQRDPLDGLLTTLSGVLDIRQVFDRVSAIAQQVIPHDALGIAELLGDGTRVRIHVTQGLGPLATPFDLDTPTRRLVMDGVDCLLIDDLTQLPDYAESPTTRAGMRSMLMPSIRVEGRQYGGLGFFSRTPGRYTSDDIMIAKRIADHVSLAISHQRLAEQAREHEVLRARRTTLELLDARLSQPIDTGSMAAVTDYISALAAAVIPHDGVILAVILPGGARARLYRSKSLPPPPESVPVPEDLQANPGWDHQIIDHLPERSEPHHVEMARLGFESLLRVPIRVDGAFAGTVIFVARSPAAYGQTDVLVVRRIADRMALVLTQEREKQSAQRAEAATAEVSKLQSRVRALTDELDARTGLRRVVGDSPRWQQVLTQATQVAPNDTTVLLLGESGTGKEVIARLVHRASRRKQGPFIALNCAALPDQLLEAELFGYERGAFTGALQSKPGQIEQAAGGTLFLDEVGELSASAQAKLLRVLQEREFQRLGSTRVMKTDARIIAATNRDLREGIRLKQFREDLYYRLNVFSIALPALRDRRDDIGPLCDAFLKELATSLTRAAAGISRDAHARLQDYHWPGNVRELRNVLERAAILCDGGLITPDHLALDLPAAGGATAADGIGAAQGDLKSMERELIERALRDARFNKSKAAKALGVTRQQLYSRIKRYGLE
jgi:transcriptional regulator with GAF, ATPase, and Fis domain